MKLEDGLYVAEVLVNDGARELRFDPSIYPCDFECGGLELTAKSRGPLEATRGFIGALAGVRYRQWVLWVQQGLRMLFTRGPRAFLEAAYWALANQMRHAHSDYAVWLRTFATPTAEELAAMAQASASLARRPVLSLITPVYNTPERFLRAMIESVLAQAYPY